MYEHTGLYDCHFSYGSMGPMAHKNTEKFLSNVVGWSINALEDLHSQGSEAIQMVVDTCSQPQKKPTYSSSAAGDSHIQSQSGRMGSSLSRPSSQGTLSNRITQSGLKYTGTQSSLPGTSGVCSIIERKEHSVMHGQQSIGSLHPELGRN